MAGKNIRVKFVDGSNFNEAIEEGKIIVSEIGDTFKIVYYDVTDADRKIITSASKVYDSYAAMCIDKTTTFTIDKIYICRNELEAYRYDGNKFHKLIISTDVDNTLDYIWGLQRTVLTADNKALAPITTASTVYTETTGETMEDVFGGENSSFISVNRYKCEQIECMTSGSRYFDINLPKTNWSVENGDIMAVFVHGTPVKSEDFMLDGSMIYLKDGAPVVSKGDIVYVMYFYHMQYDMNAGVQMNTQNYADYSITQEKLDKNIKLSANNINETTNRKFISPTALEKLNGIEDHATNYSHPTNHPASIIVTDDAHQFVSKTQMAKWDNKVEPGTVYTTDQIDNKFRQLIDGAGADLDSLKELGAALNNDPNFATSIIQRLSQKADQTSVDNINENLVKKVDITDYVKVGITAKGTLSINKTDGVSYYNISYSDTNMLDYADMMMVTMRVTGSNQGPAQMRINSLGYKKILTQDGYDLISGELKVGSIYTLRYNGESGNFILLGKGGVKLTNSTQNEYKLYGNYPVTRGDLIELKNGKAIKSIYAPSIHSSVYSSNVNHRCTGRTKIFYMNTNQAMVFWQIDGELRAQAFTFTDDNFNIATTKTYTVINSTVVGWDVAQVHGTDFLIGSYDSTGKCVRVTQLSYHDGSFFGAADFVTYQCNNETVSNISAVKTGTGEAVLAFSCSAYTKIMYFTCAEFGTVPVLKMTDASSTYPINRGTLVGKDQIVYTKALTNGTICVWVLNLARTSYAFTKGSLQYVDSESTSLMWMNPITTEIDKDAKKGVIRAAASDGSEMHCWEITCDVSRGITVNKEYSHTLFSAGEVNSYDTNELVRVGTGINAYVSISPYWKSQPHTSADNNGDPVWKVATYEYVEGFRVMRVSNAIQGVPTGYSVCMIDKRRAIAAINYDPKDDTDRKLALCMIDVRRTVDAIAVSGGKPGDIVKVSEW